MSATFSQVSAEISSPSLQPLNSDVSSPLSLSSLTSHRHPAQLYRPHLGLPSDRVGAIFDGLIGSRSIPIVRKSGCTDVLKVRPRGVVPFAQEGLGPFAQDLEERQGFLVVRR